MGALVGGWLFGSLKWHEWKPEVHSSAHLTPRARVVRIVPEILQDLFLFRARHRGSTACRSIPGNKKCTTIFSAATFLRIPPALPPSLSSPPPIVIHVVGFYLGRYAMGKCGEVRGIPDYCQSQRSGDVMTHARI